MNPTKHHFAQASLELDRGTIDRGLWAMATARARGNQDQAAATYLQLRAEELARESAQENLGKVVGAAKTAFGEFRRFAVILGYSVLFVPMSVLVAIFMIAGEDFFDAHKAVLFGLSAVVTALVAVAFYLRRP